jgi:hypothetical protein
MHCCWVSQLSSAAVEKNALGVTDHAQLPVDYFRGNPRALLAERRRKLQAARGHRKQENLKLRQRIIPWSKESIVSYPKRASVSL